MEKFELDIKNRLTVIIKRFIMLNVIFYNVY